MEDVQKRLTETSKACDDAYEAWKDNRKDEKLRETLAEAVHELRKVSSRLEIEIAIAERDDAGRKPIPIPPHKSQMKKKDRKPLKLDESEKGTAKTDHADDDDMPDFIKNGGDNNNNGRKGGSNNGGKPKRKYTRRKKNDN